MQARMQPVLQEPLCQDPSVCPLEALSALPCAVGKGGVLVWGNEEGCDQLWVANSFCSALLESSLAVPCSGICQCLGMEQVQVSPCACWQLWLGGQKPNAQCWCRGSVAVVVGSDLAVSGPRVLLGAQVDAGWRGMWAESYLRREVGVCPVAQAPLSARLEETCFRKFPFMLMKEQMRGGKKVSI